MATIIIGIGNPVLTDDSVGLQVVRQLRNMLSSNPDIVTRELCAGGLRLVEAMAGYERAIIIDAIVSEGGHPGAVCILGPSDLKASKNTCCTHDARLREALELGKMAGLRLPEEIRIWAIEAGDVETFSEGLTPEVRQAVPGVVDSVARHLAANRSLPA